MIIDSAIVENYLQGNSNYETHWIYSKLAEHGEYLFERPDIAIKEEIHAISGLVASELENFSPYNRKLMDHLFPEWRAVLEKTHILLSVGCPAPYDAMVRNHQGTKYIIFDLTQLLQYQKDGMDISKILKGLITHEMIHVCIRKDYSCEHEAYEDKLRFIAFDEGFAHLLSLRDEISRYDFSEMLNKHYDTSKKKYNSALLETDKSIQEKNIVESNTGDYWNKFAAIVGKLYLAQNMDRLVEIYRSGPRKFDIDL